MLNSLFINQAIKQLSPSELACVVFDCMPDWQDFELLAKKHQNRDCHWLFLLENNVFQAACTHPMAQSLNPRGISIYPLSPRHTVWVFPKHYQHQIRQHFPNKAFISAEKISFTQEKPAMKPWFRLPETHNMPEQVVIIGGGIAAASSARALAEQNIQVIVLTEQQIAKAASGNQQGLLYAKISPYETIQSRLLLKAYGYALGILRHTLPENEYWQQCGVLHLNDSEIESKRNQAIAQTPSSLYQLLNRAQASQISGIPLEQGGLFWPLGAWIHPPALVRALFNHANIQVYEHCHVSNMNYQQREWQVSSECKQTFSGSHLLLCTGASSELIAQWGLNIRAIRGQTTLACATEQSRQLKIALSGASYIAPHWQGLHCFGATFHPQEQEDTWRESDDELNKQALKKLNQDMYHRLYPAQKSPKKGHAALRADAFDHLPIVGAVGDAPQMRAIYQKLALDKNYRIQAACPYLPNAYVNIAHGSRGLLSSSLAACALVAQMCDKPHPFSDDLKAALSPNRLIIRDIIHKTHIK